MFPKAIFSNTNNSTRHFTNKLRACCKIFRRAGPGKKPRETKKAGWNHYNIRSRRRGVNISPTKAVHANIGTNFSFFWVLENPDNSHRGLHGWNPGDSAIGPKIRGQKSIICALHPVKGALAKRGVGVFKNARVWGKFGSENLCAALFWGG